MKHGIVVTAGAPVTLSVPRSAQGVYALAYANPVRTVAASRTSLVVVPCARAEGRQRVAWRLLRPAAGVRPARRHRRRPHHPGEPLARGSLSLALYPRLMAPPSRRLVAVLGYSTRRDRELHPICRARLESAALEAREGDAVVLSGGRHRALGRPEADAMLELWSGPEGTVVPEREALTTAENARHVRAVALELGVSEVVVVTSSWHSPRADEALPPVAARHRGARRRRACPHRVVSGPAAA